MPTLAQFVAFVQQAGMYIRANQMQARFANLLDGVVEVNVTAGNTTLAANSASLQYGTLKLIGTPGAAFNLNLPDGYTGTRRIINDSGRTATVKTVSGTGVAVADGETAALVSDGTNVTSAAGVDTSAFLQKASNLSDLPSAAAARTNLGLGDVAAEFATLTKERLSVDVTSGDVVLTAAQARHGIIYVHGSPGVPRTVTFPDTVQGWRLVNNSTNSDVTFNTPENMITKTFPAGLPEFSWILIWDGAEILSNSAIPLPFDANKIVSGTVAVARLPVGTTPGTVAAGDDARFGAGGGGDGTGGALYLYNNYS